MYSYHLACDLSNAATASCSSSSNGWIFSKIVEYLMSGAYNDEMIGKHIPAGVRELGGYAPLFWYPYKTVGVHTLIVSSPSRMRKIANPALSLDVGLHPCCEGRGGNANTVDIGVLKAGRLLVEKLGDLAEKRHVRDKREIK